MTLDLYRTFRVALYLLATTSAIAIYMADHDIRYLWFTLIATMISRRFVDTGIIQPVRPAFGAMLSLALLLMYLAPALSLLQSGMREEAAALMAKFLCVLQVSLFFTTFRGSTLFTFCGSSLFVVIVSGYLDPGPGLLLRLALFLAAATWTMFLHTLYSQRQRFHDSQNTGIEAARREGPPPGLSSEACWQGLRLTFSVTAASLAMGFVLFFFWPRSETSLLNTVRSVLHGPRNENGPERASESEAEFQSVIRKELTGLAKTVNLEQLGNIREDLRAAAQVDLDRPAGDTACAGVVYLRARALSHFLNNRWINPDKTDEFKWTEKRDPDGRPALVALPPSMFGPAAGGSSLLRHTVMYTQSPGRVYLSLGQPRNLRPTVDDVGIFRDEEETLLTRLGSALNPDNADFSYEVQAQPPVDQERLPPRAELAFPNERYLDFRNSFHDATLAARLEQCARRECLLRNAHTPLEKIRALRDFLQNSGHFQYTLKLAEVPRDQRDYLADFIFGMDERQRRGHCGYFSTAFVMLCRSAGVPARLALGFAHPLDADRASRRLVFHNAEAHAWIEVCFKDYGWVAFDATPRAQGGQIRPTTPPETEVAQSPGNSRRIPGGGAGSNGEAPGVLRKSWNYFMSYDRQDQKQVYSTLSGAVHSFIDAFAKLFVGLGEWGAAGAMVAWVTSIGLLGWLLYGYLRHKSRARGTASLSPKQRAAVDFYNELLLALARRGFTRRNGQTPREFAEAVVRRGGLSYAPVRIVTEIFEQVRYGGTQPEPSQWERLQVAMTELRQRVQEK